MDLEELFSSTCEHNWINKVEQYWLQGHDLNALHPYLKISLLHHAAEHTKLEAIQWLVQHGADINCKGYGGWTPLHIGVDSDIDGAIQTNKELTMPATRLLIALGADILSKNDHGQTPRDIAAVYGQKTAALYDSIIKR